MGTKLDGDYLVGIQAVKAFPDSPLKFNFVAREIIKIGGAHITATDVHGGRLPKAIHVHALWQSLTRTSVLTMQAAKCVLMVP